VIDRNGHQSVKTTRVGSGTRTRRIRLAVTRIAAGSADPGPSLPEFPPVRRPGPQGSDPGAPHSAESRRCRWPMPGMLAASRARPATGRLTTWTARWRRLGITDLAPDCEPGDAEAINRRSLVNGRS
jgi:hypothetical protein